MLYGEPRVTNDIDLVVFLRTEDASKLNFIFPSPEFYVPPTEAIVREIAREPGGHFNLIHTASGLKCDCYTSGRDELHFWALRLKQQYTIGATIVTLAPPEYVIIRKLEYYRQGRSENTCEI